MEVISIKNWSETFENAESRKRQRLRFMHVPTGNDSSGYVTLMGEHQEKGVMALGIFQAMCQAMATLPKDTRGQFRKSDGTPMSRRHIAALIRIDFALFESCLEILASEGVTWISIEENEGTSQSSPNNLPPVSQSPPAVTNIGGEGIGEDRREIGEEGEGEGAHSPDPPEVGVEVTDGPPVSLEVAKQHMGQCRIPDEAIVESWFFSRSADNWKRPKGERITASTWRHDLTAYGLAWQQTDAERGRGKAPEASQRDSGPREAWQIEKDIERVEGQIRKLDQDYNNWTFRDVEGVSKKVMTETAREQLRRLKDKKQKLETELNES